MERKEIMRLSLALSIVFFAIAAAGVVTAQGWIPIACFSVCGLVLLLLFRVSQRGSWHDPEWNNNSAANQNPCTCREGSCKFHHLP